MRRPPFLLVFAAAIALQAQQSPDNVRFKALDKTIEAAPPQQRIAYNAVLVAFTTFRDARAGQELCLPLTPCEQKERARLNSEFLLRAEGLQPAELPVFTRDDLEKEDAALNAAYEHMLALLPESCGFRGCLSKDTFRNVQRDWIRYRDAWITFATLRWPRVMAEGWQTLLTRGRTAEIGQIPKEALEAR